MQFHLFNKQVYTSRRDALKKAIGTGVLLFMGNEESSMNYKDNCYPFRQDSSFLYYFGLDVPGLVAIIDIDNGEEIIFGHELTLDEIIWTGPLPSLHEMAAKVGVQKTLPYEEIAAWTGKVLAAKRTVHILPPYRPENQLKLSAWLQVPVAQLKEKVSVPFIQAVVQQRVHKEACEIEEMEKAVSISVDMHLAAIQYTRPGMKEYEIAAKVQEVALAADGRLAYPTILTVNGGVLHNHYHGNTIQEGQMLLCDAGAENNMHYAGDLTRTFPVGNHFTSRQKEVYEIVLAAMNHAISLLKPGITYKEVHTRACEKLVEGLTAIQLMKGDPREAVQAGAHTLFFQCGLGHMIGMDVHDMEDLGEEYVGYSEGLTKSREFGWKSLRLARALEPGFVLTVEPGVYIIPEQIDRWQAERKHEAFINYTLLNSYRDFSGVRIEDNFLITADGARVLGKHLPKTLAEIEALRSY